MSERILIVDDDPVQRRLLDNMVRRLGYEPIVVDGGEAAVAALLASDGSRIAAVVLDLVMPDLDGLGVLARMREAGLATPVLVQTAHGGIDNVVTAMRAGAADFVVKPVGAERLQVSLRNALAASALEGELARIKRSRAGTRARGSRGPGCPDGGDPRLRCADAARRKRRRSPARGHRGGSNSVRDHPLSRADVRGRTTIAHRPLDPLSQARFPGDPSGRSDRCQPCVAVRDRRLRKGPRQICNTL